MSFAHSYYVPQMCCRFVSNMIGGRVVSPTTKLIEFFFVYGVANHNTERHPFLLLNTQLTLKKFRRTQERRLGNTIGRKQYPNQPPAKLGIAS